MKPGTTAAALRAKLAVAYRMYSDSKSGTEFRVHTPPLGVSGDDPRFATVVADEGRDLFTVEGGAFACRGNLSLLTPDTQIDLILRALR